MQLTQTGPSETAISLFVTHTISRTHFGSSLQPVECSSNSLWDDKSLFFLSRLDF